MPDMSRWLVGSSKMRRSGWVRRPAAREARLRSPPERVETGEGRRWRMRRRVATAEEEVWRDQEEGEQESIRSWAAWREAVKEEGVELGGGFRERWRARV